MATHVEHRHGNQVAERLNRRLKQIMRGKTSSFMGLDEKQSRKALNKLAKLKEDQVFTLTRETVDMYNSNPHKFLKKETPEAMEKILLQAESDGLVPTPIAMKESLIIESEFKELSGRTILAPLEPLLAYSGSEEAAQMLKLRDDAVQHYNDKWAGLVNAIVQSLSKIFDKLEINNQKTLEAVESSKQDIISSIKEESENVINKQKCEILTLKETIDSQSSSIKYLEEQGLLRELAEKQAAARREQRKTRKRLPIRDAATYPEFDAAIQVVNQNDRYRSEFARARDVVSLPAIYLTGMRIGELEYCTRATLEGFLDADSVQLVVSKAHNKQRMVPLGKTSNELAERYWSEISLLTQNKELTDLVFTAEGRRTPIERTWSSKRINGILTAAGKKVSNVLKAHSFRIGHINALIEIGGVETARELIGHNRIDTTDIYSRRSR